MKQLFEIMAEDMGITPYQGESEPSYIYRVLLSALGLWCLTYARTQTKDINGVSKNAHSLLLHHLIDEYVSIYPSIRSFFEKTRLDIAVFIRNLYEQTGYFLLLNNNYNMLNSEEQSIYISDTNYLYLGVPSEEFSVNGLGIHCKHPYNEYSIQDFLIRDSLTPIEYIKESYNLCDFEERDINPLELEFFDTQTPVSLAKSWKKSISSKFSVARKDVYGPYYKIIVGHNKKIFYCEDLNTGDDSTSITGAEFRRLYIALRNYYNKPMVALKCPIDDEYTHIKINGQMPNREYFYFLLNGWPKNFITDRYNFIMRNEMVPQSLLILEQLGFKIKNGVYYG